jgi:ubiquinone/menaquinone biosynthesis C-methylase UbiE
MKLFGRKPTESPLVVGMTGVKMGDRIAQVGCAHGGRLAAVAAKVGLSGRAVAIVPDQASATRAQKGAASEGVLVDVEIAPPTALPLDDLTIDLLIVDDTGGLFGSLPNAERGQSVREALRVLRPGGRVMVIGAVAGTGLAALLGRAPSGPAFDPKPALEADGFKFVRHLAEREGLSFVEGLKPRS